MPRLTERMHRHLCRAGFVVLCILPTLGVTGAIINAHLPSQRTAWEDELARRLDARVTIAAIAFPQPGLTRIDGLTIFEAGSHQALAKMDRLQLRRVGGIWRADVHAVELSAGTRGLWPLLVRCAKPAADRAACAVQLAADRVIFSGAGAKSPLRHVTGRLEPGEIQHLTFRALVDNDDSAVQLDLNSQADGTWDAALDTGTNSLSAAMLALWLPPAADLGAEATVRGSLSCNMSATGIGGRFAGQFDGIDFGGLTAGVLPADQALQGRTQIVLSEVRFESGRLISAAGSLHCERGFVGPRLLEGAVEAMKMRPGEPVAVIGAPIHFGELACDFSLDAKVLKIAGRCANAPPGTLLTSRDDGRVLLTTAGTEPQPPTSLVRMLSPPSLDWVPATPLAQRMLNLLPRSDINNTASRKR